MAYLDQKTSTNMQSNARRHIKTWRISRAKLQQLTLLEIDITKERQTQTQTQTPTQIQTQMQRWLIVASVSPTFHTAIPLLWHSILLWPCALLVAKRQNLPRRKLLNCSVRVDVLTAKRSGTINRNVLRSGNLWQLSQTQTWHWL